MASEQKRRQPNSSSASDNDAKHRSPPKRPAEPQGSAAMSTLRLLLPSAQGTILVLGIYVFFLAFGYFQESVYQIGNKAAKDTFRFPVFLVAVLCIGNVLVSGAILYVELQFKVRPDVDPPTIDDAGVKHQLVSPTMGDRKQQIKNNPTFMERYVIHMDRSALRDIGLTSITYVISMLATNYALSHVSYPTQVLVKSAKSVPVVLGGFVVFGKRYPFHDYVAVVAVTVSLIVFNFSTSKSSSSHQTILGLTLLGVSLFCDSLTGPRQDHLLARVRISSTHLMFLTNVFGSIIACVACLMLEGLQPLWFCMRFPAVNLHVLLFCLCAALGQFFIFASLTAFGSLYLTLVTTTRKFFTVLLSVIVFNHHVSLIQWICVTVIFSSLAAQSYYTKKLKMKAASAKKA